MPTHLATDPEAKARAWYQSWLPDWLQPEATPSVFDPWYREPVRKAVRAFGLDDPSTATVTAMGMAAGGGRGGTMGRLYEEPLPTSRWAQLAAPEPGLDASKTARLARAAKQGYGRTYYHETAQPNVPSLTMEGFRPRVSAAGLDAGTPHGVFMKDTPEMIGVGQGPQGDLSPRQLSVRTRAQNIKAFTNRAELQQEMAKDPMYQKQRYAWAKWRSNFPVARRKAAQALYPGRSIASLQAESDTLMANGASQEQTPLYKVHQAVLAEDEARIHKIRTAGQAYFKRQGIDGVSFREQGAMDFNQPMHDVHTTIIFDPAQIRSTEAMFDPAKKNLPNLFYGGAGVIGGLYGAGQSPKVPEE